MKKTLNFFWLFRPDVNFHKLLSMKIAILLLFCGILNIMAGSSYSVSAKISSSPYNSSVGDALEFVTELQQQRTISGTVTDASTGEIMPGVNILVKGTSIGTITCLLYTSD